ncbi:MAG: single-stranded-DNA-specific exonuclease RecJ, partial [Synechococcales bacterium]|nr:single-stranded-DNA-specific exonuclease RecJ [Synechococcales bacterium]
PDQRWFLHPAQPELALQFAQALQISPIIAQVLLNRHLTTIAQAKAFLDPDIEILPSPLVDFPALPLSLELLINAIHQEQPIAICGDYDADGMTSTALLLRSLRALGAKVDYAIPSRMAEGYGINTRIVEEFHREGIQVILTVDNGIAAYEPIARARQLGLTVIITDHHDVPETIPPANAILNPKLIAETSPYRTMAGVGVAYVLALCLAESLGRGAELRDTLLELFTLGTIADLAPLTGVNRRWVRRGLHLLPHSTLPGVQALIQVSGLGNERNLKPDAIGFRLGPRINAVGRIGDPQVVIELLTTDDDGIALERAMQCESINQQRQQLCEKIELEAIETYENGTVNAKDDRVLLLVQPGWHHGVIGIVASRLVERYGVPVFIGTYEAEDDRDTIRGSARGIPEFNVFEGLETCQGLTIKHGGHRAAGGFTLEAENLEPMRSRLSQYAHTCLQPQHLKPLITVDARVDFNDIDYELYEEIDALHPCGMENAEPVFWTPNVQILDQKLVGRGHIKLTLLQADLQAPQPTQRLGKRFSAIAWRWGDYYPLPNQLDLAYRIKTNEWQGEISIQLEVIGAKMPNDSFTGIEFQHRDRHYLCTMNQQQGQPELRIRNAKGEILTIQKGQRIGSLGKRFQDPQAIDVTQEPYYSLVKAAADAWRSVETQKPC